LRLSVAVQSLARVSAASGLVVSVLMATAAPAGADETVFQAQTAAAGVHLVLTQQPASSIVTAGLVDDATAYAAGAFDSSGGSEAQAASVFPGTLVVQGPALFCSQVFTCPATPPDYPLLADASYPRRAHAEASADQKPVGQGPLVVTPSASTATATGAGNSGQTAAGRVSVLSGSPVGVTAGSSTASTQVTTTATSLVTHVESTVSDIDIAGLVHIRSIRSSDDITVSASGKPIDRPQVTITGVTVAGVPAQIDDKGVHVAGQNGPSLSQQVAQQGVDIRTVGAQRNDSAALARSQATGLIVTFSLPVSGLTLSANVAGTLSPTDLRGDGSIRATRVGLGPLHVADATLPFTFDSRGVVIDPRTIWVYVATTHGSSALDDRIAHPRCNSLKATEVSRTMGSTTPAWKLDIKV